MNKEDLEEFIRRLRAEGFSFQMVSEESGRVTADNGMSASVEDDGTILFKRESRPLAQRILEIFNQVREYMTAFRNAAQNTANHDKWHENTRTLLLFNNCELAASRFSDNRMEFITWRLDNNGEREIGHYFSDFADAKRDFAIRAELINRDMLFTERQLSVIQSYLSDYLAYDNASITRKQEDDIREVISKIDNVIVPEIYEKAEEAEELGDEPELEI